MPSTASSACPTCGWTPRRWSTRPHVAEAGGNPQLAENFRRAAELALIDDEEVMALYEALRPHRSTAAELEELRASLERGGAAAVRGAGRAGGLVYARRGLLR